MFRWFKSVLTELQGIHEELKQLRALMSRGVDRSKESEEAVKEAQKVMNNFLNMIPKPKIREEKKHEE